MADWAKLHLVANAIEKEDRVKFDMNDYIWVEKDCGTLACVAGFAVFLFDRKAWNAREKAERAAWHDPHFSFEVNLFDIGKNALQLTDPEATHLFTFEYVEDSYDWYYKVNQDKPHTVRALRWMADNKVIDWPRAWDATEGTTSC